MKKNKRTDVRQKPRPKMINEKIEICFPENGREIDRESLYQTLSEITFNLVSIPVYGYRSLVFNSEETNGTTIVGFVNGWDPELKQFTVSLYENAHNALTKAGERKLSMKLALYTTLTGKVNKVSKFIISAE